MCTDRDRTNRDKEVEEKTMAAANEAARATARRLGLLPVAAEVAGGSERPMSGIDAKRHLAIVASDHRTRAAELDALAASIPDNLPELAVRGIQMMLALSRR